MGSDTEKPRAPPDPKAPAVETDKPNYFWLETTTEDTEQDKPTRNAPGTQCQQGRERHHPKETIPRLQAARDVVVRALNGWRKGIPVTNNNEDFETFAARSMVRILKRTAGLLENTEKEA